MYRQIIYVIIFFSFSNIYSQNAFYDAVVLSRNKVQLLDKLRIILEGNNSTALHKICSGTQIMDLNNLKLFIENPWDTSINGKLNFKVIFELPGIIENLIPVAKDELIKKIADLTNEAQKTRTIIVDISNKSKLDSNRLTDINSLPDSLKTENVILERDSLTKVLAISQEKLIEQKNNLISITNDSLNKQIIVNNFDNIKPNIPDFKSAVLDTKNSFSIFAQETDKNIDVVNISKPFKISEAAIIESIVDAVSEQVLNDVYNLLINNIRFKAELKVLFPKTIAKLSDRTINEGNVVQNLNSLKRIFTDDLNNILTNITNEKNYEHESKLKKIKEDSKESFYYLKLSVDLINILKDGFHPTEMISMLVNKSDKYKNQFPEYFIYLEFIDALQKNLKEVSNTNSQWINFTKLEELNTTELQHSSASYFIGFIYQLDREKFKVLKDSFTTDNVFDPSKFHDFKKSINDFVVSLNVIEANIKSFNSGNTSSVETYLNNIKNIVSETEKSKNNAKYVLDDKQLKDFGKVLENINKYLDYTISIYKTIHDGSYASLLVNVIDIYTKELSKDKNTIFVKELSKYTSFFVDVSNSRSQQELNYAVSKAVGNWGGVLRKHEKSFVISVNSYPGLYLGSEKINDKDGKLQGGFTLPLGLNVQLYKYIGVFGQVFDLTAAFNWRFNDTNSTNLPENITFKQMLSPGVFISIAPFKIPFVINFGAAYTTELRTLKNDNTTLEKSRSVRWSAGIFYDVPLWHIWSW